MPIHGRVALNKFEPGGGDYYCAEAAYLFYLRGYANQTCAAFTMHFLGARSVLQFHVGS